MNDLKARLIETVRRNTSVLYEEVEIEKINDFIAELEMDSVVIMQLLIDIEETFDIQFDDDLDYDQIRSFQKLLEYILRKKEVKSDDVI